MRLLHFTSPLARGGQPFGTRGELGTQALLGHFIIIQPKFLKFGTTWFRISFLFAYVYSYKFSGILTPILQKLIKLFLIITAFVFLPLHGIHTGEQHKNDYNSRSACPILMKLVSIPMFSRMGFLNMQFEFT